MLRVSCAPTTAELQALLALVDAARERGAVRVSFGAMAMEFDRPLDLTPPSLPTEALNREERAELAELREERQFQRELGNG